MIIELEVERGDVNEADYIYIYPFVGIDPTESGATPVVAPGRMI